MPRTSEHSGRGRKLVGPRKGSSRPRRRNPPMRKVSKKGAYRASQKKNFMRKRAAVVETKRKTLEDLRQANYFAGTGTNPITDHTAFTAHNTEHVHMNPLTYYLWSQGLGQDQHIGNNVTVKHLNMKIQVRFPQPSMNVAGTPQIIPSIPQHYELVWGWVPAPYQFTGTTTPAVNACDLTQLKEHVNHRVNDYFNSRKDFLRFIPKKDATIRIIGRKRVVPDMRFQSTAPPSAPGVATNPTGTIPDYHTEISWKMPNGGKKVWLEQTGNLDGGNKLVAMFPNYSWLPFCVLVNWNHDELVATHPTSTILYCPSIAWNDIVYYTDS